MERVKALVIDDSRIERTAVMKSLNQARIAEFEFAEAGNGQDALAMLDALRPDIVFVDWNLEGMSGAEFVRRVRESEEERVAVVMVASRLALSKLEEALDGIGADGWIRKPFKPRELTRKLAPIFDAIRAARRNDPPEPGTRGGTPVA